MTFTRVSVVILLIAFSHQAIAQHSDFPFPAAHFANSIADNSESGSTPQIQPNVSGVDFALGEEASPGTPLIQPTTIFRQDDSGSAGSSDSEPSGIMGLFDDSSSGKSKKWYEKLNVRGYAQFRFNEIVHTNEGSAPPNYPSDGSISNERNFIIRRARIAISGDVHERVYVYLQPEFASNVPNSTDSDYFLQIRDWYADLYLTEDKVHRVRAGQSKIPYGWENLQSSSNRIPLDRGDGMNSAVRNERDIGLIYYYTPESVQELFDYIQDNGLKGSGNYGMFGAGIYNGQGGSLRDRNERLHSVVRFTYPFRLANDQIFEVGVQGYNGRYVVLGAPIEPLGIGPPTIPAGTEQSGDDRGLLDQRIAASFIMYPQPLGFQAEWNVGRGPSLNDAQTEVVVRSLTGGYVMLFSKHDTENYGTYFPFVRYSHFMGGYKAFRNAPYADVRDWEVGCEWQINKAAELTATYLFADRTNIDSQNSGLQYEKFEGNVLRFQLQINY